MLGSGLRGKNSTTTKTTVKKTHTDRTKKKMHQEQNIGVSNSSKVSKLKPLYQNIRVLVPLKH